MVRLNLPSALTLVLGLLGGVLEYLNTNTFGFTAPWREVITYGLYALAVIGVSPLVHSAFRNALHLSAGVSVTITILATLLAAAITTFSGMSLELQGILQGVVAFLAFVGFGPAAASVLAAKTA